MANKDRYSMLPLLKELHVPILSCDCGVYPCHGLYIQTRIGQIECLHGMREHGTYFDTPLIISDEAFLALLMSL